MRSLRIAVCILLAVSINVLWANAGGIQCLLEPVRDGLEGSVPGGVLALLNLLEAVNALALKETVKVGVL